MQSSKPETLRQALILAAVPAGSALTDGERAVSLSAVLGGSCLGRSRRELTGKSVLVAVATQLDAALTLIDLDGFARRLVLLPPDVKKHQLAAIIRDAGVNAAVCSDPVPYAEFGLETVVVCGGELRSDSPDTEIQRRTEWLMLTSGTTGDAKIAVHTLGALMGAIAPASTEAQRPVWATFYDIRRYGGLQIFLRAVLCGGSLILSRPDEPVAGHLSRLAAAKVTHMSGTPTHWRRALMSAAVTALKPSYIRLSGEIADQSILDALHSSFPGSAIGHAYASTEAGVGFDVNDGREGFPSSYLGEPRNGVEMRIVGGALRIRSNRTASAYAGRPDLPMGDAEGWVDTGDIVEQRDGRCYFAGRRGGIINVGGLKVHPEEIETVINRHDAVRQSRVKPRKSPVIGAIVVADVVLRDDGGDIEKLKQDIMALCRDSLPAHKIPAVLNVVADIEMTAGGKVSRQHA